MSIKTASNSDLLKTLGAGALGGAGLAALLKLLNSIGNRSASKRVVDINKDYGPADVGSIPVYVDMTPEQAKKYEAITGQKVGQYTEKDVLTKIAYTKTSSDWNTLAYGGAAIGGGYIGYKIVKKLIDNISKRNLKRRLDTVKQELADLYEAEDMSADNAAELPGVKKLGSLKDTIDGLYEVFEKNAEINKLYMMHKTAGIVGDIANVGFKPITTSGSSLLYALAPIMLAIAATSGLGSYFASRGDAGSRNKLKAYRSTLDEDKPAPYIELRPRIKQKVKELDPAEVG